MGNEKRISLNNIMNDDYTTRGEMTDKKSSVCNGYYRDPQCFFSLSNSAVIKLDVSGRLGLIKVNLDDSFAVC